MPDKPQQRLTEKTSL